MMNFPQSLQNNNIEVGGELKSPLPLKQFFILEFLKVEFVHSIQNAKVGNFLSSLNSIIDLQLESKPDNLLDRLRYVIDIIRLNKLENDTIFLTKQGGSKQERRDWDYDYRSFTEWFHLLASHYGWDVETINNLNPNFACYLIQEILVNDQFDKEWVYSLSEMAYRYDSNTKTSKYEPLDRPSWMAEYKPITKQKMLKSTLPFGVTVLSGVDTPNAIEYLEN